VPARTAPAATASGTSHQPMLTSAMS
jgi:hypothetical protein